MTNDAEPQASAVELVERLFGILRDCRAIVRALESNADCQESPAAAAERDLYYVLVGAMEEGDVRTAEHVLTVLHQAQAPLGPMGKEWLKRHERGL